MKIIDRFLNREEEIALQELSSVAADNALRVFPKTRLSDVLLKGDARLPERIFNYYTRSHFDFLVIEPNGKPFMAIEYDGPFHHTDPKQAERDQIKNQLCKDSGLPLLRVNANHVIRKFRGMTLLRWIIEVTQTGIAFDKAQAAGHIPYDEPFDPAMIFSDGSGRKWPYWLSVDAARNINNFLRGQVGEKAWVTMAGSDRQGNLHHFQYLRINDKFLCVKTAARYQDVNIPVFDMLDQISQYEMGEQLEKYLQGNVPPLSYQDFNKIHDQMCSKYGMHARIKRTL